MIVGLILAVGLAAPCQRRAPTDTLRLAAVGDINLGRRLARERLLSGDTLYPFRAVREWLAADITFGNLESPIAPDSSQPSDTSNLFAAPPLAAMALARAGFDIVSTANNHAWDAGQAGVTETMRQLTRAGVRFVGSGFGRDMAEQPVVLERRGWRVAVFAVTRAWNPAPYAFYQHAGANWIAWGQPAWIYPAIAALRASGRADLIIVSVHGGHEYVDEPPDYLRDFLYGLVDAGADLVLAHHPHVLQPVVWHAGKPIVQSLGNFVFVQADPWTRLSVILKIVVAPDHTMQLSAIPVRVGAQPQLATGAAADSVRRRVHVPLSTPTVPNP